MTTTQETLVAREDFLAQLRRVNTERYHAWVGDGQDAGILFDAAELGGEVGELLNVVKKLVREEAGWRGSRAAPGDFADECADVLICLDKLARRRGVDLAEATAHKFNATSDKQGFPHKLTLTATPPVPDVATIPVGMKPTRDEIIREWVGGERYARDYEYCDANFGAQADRILALFAAYTPKPAPVAAVGMKLVPVEPTEAMIFFGEDAAAGPQDLGNGLIRAIWSAMHAAAPDVATGGGDALRQDGEAATAGAEGIAQPQSVSRITYNGE
jgi:NTP pyrophosphatase (non-canonical NTP hydrolase)